MLIDCWMQLKWWTAKQMNRQLNLLRCQGIGGASLMWRLLRRAWPLHNTFWRALCTATSTATLHAETAGPAPAILALPSRFKSPQNQVNGFNTQCALYADWFFGGAFLEPLCFLLVLWLAQLKLFLRFSCIMTGTILVAPSQVLDPNKHWPIPHNTAF